MQPQANKVSQPVVEEVINTMAEADEEEAKFGKRANKKGGCGKGMNRKALKNLIQSELEKQSKSIFVNILKQPIDGVEETKDPQEQKDIVHANVACDGCETAPITGIRYKCSVCKNFDYCSNCEERLNHEHPFLKIKNPASVPEVMITILPDIFEQAEGQSQPQGEQQHPFGFGGRGGRCGRGGRGGHGFKKMVGQFLEQMGMNVEDVTKKFQENTGGCGWNKQNWQEKRAEIVTFPEDVLEAQPNQMLLPAIQLKNGTAWPWKYGCTLTLANEAGEGIENLPIEMVNVPIDHQVVGHGIVNLSVPLKVRENAIAEDKVHEIKLAMRGPGGAQFGQVLTLKLKVVRPSGLDDEIQVYKLAMSLAEQGLGSFDECVAAVKENDDEEAAKKALKQRKL